MNDYVTQGCECDLRDRRWNPNTGRCETCRANWWPSPAPSAAPCRTERKAPDWHQERVEWNTSGKCARKVCTNPHADMVHVDSGLLYCLDCARLINCACNKELVTHVSADDPRPR